MALASDFLDAVEFAVDRSSDPLVVRWPMPGHLNSVRSFDTFAAWRRFVLHFSLHPSLPKVVAVKFERAQKLYLLAWIDPDLIKAGELVAMTALELALRDRRSVAEKAKDANTKKPSFAALLKDMVALDGLTDDQLPMKQRYGYSFTVVAQLTGETRPSLADIRNRLAHGDPFDGLPWSGLLELVRDLIDYAYRRWIAEVSG
jgi:hypothetical protein